MTSALAAVGWPFGVPACLVTAIENGCKAAVKAAFKRHMRRLVATRRLGLPTWAKNGLKGCAKAVINTIIDCISQQVKSLGVAQLSKIPGVKMVANKLVGGAIDSLTAKIKQIVDKAVDSAINKLRRRRAWGLPNPIAAVKSAAGAVAGAAKSAASKVAGAVVNVAKGAAEFAKNAAKVAGDVANKVQAVAAKLDKLTGGKLSSAIQNYVCPAVAQGVKAAMTSALAAVGWPFGVPACLITAVENGCKAAVKAAFKRHMRRLQMRVRCLNGQFLDMTKSYPRCCYYQSTYPVRVKVCQRV